MRILKFSGSSTASAFKANSRQEKHYTLLLKYSHRVVKNYLEKISCTGPPVCLTVLDINSIELIQRAEQYKSSVVLY